MTLRSILEQAAICFSDPARRESYFDIYADEVVLHRSPPLAPGKEAVKAFYRGYWNAFPDIKLQLGTMVENDSLLGCEFTVWGTHKQAFLGLPPTGRSFQASGVTLLRFQGQLCVERWSQTDLLGLARQLGASLQASAHEQHHGPVAGAA